MKKSFCMLLSVALVLGLSLLAISLSPAALAAGGVKATRAPQVAGSSYVPGELLVKFKSGAAGNALASLKKTVGAFASEKLGSPNVEKLKLNGPEIDSALALLRRSPQVEYAVPNYIRHLQYTPDDPDYPTKQWNLNQPTSGGGVNMSAAWDIVQGGDPGVVVAILDTGVAYETANGYAQAPDLAGTNFVQGYDFVNNDPYADDDHGHGTHVCGTIAQSTNNSVGVAGIAFKCTVMPVKVMDQEGSGNDEQIVEGIIFATDNGAKVINMSLGGPEPSPALEDTCNYAVSKGVVVCAATGNESRSTVDYPAGYPACIAVAATTRSLAIASYSNYGDSQEVEAPGGQGPNQIVQQTYRTLGDPTSDFIYRPMQGTSMATPHVAGEAALIRSLHPDWTVQDVKADIYGTCKSVGSQSLYGYGIIDIAAALGAPKPPSTFYFAEGTCRPNFDPYFCIQNPGSSDANVTITYMKGDATTTNQNLTVPKNTRSTVRVKDSLGEADDIAHDFSSKVECTNDQQIIAERPMYFNYQGASNLNWTGGHDVIGATSPSSTFYFAEGTCRPNFDPYFCIQNPGGTAADVTLTYMKGDGTTATDQVSVPPNARSTVAPRTKLGTGDDTAHDFSTKVECTNDQQIIAERPMYFNYQGASNLNWTGGHDVIGATP